MLNYVSNSKNSFNAEGNCIVEQLPFEDFFGLESAKEDFFEIDFANFSKRANVAELPEGNYTYFEGYNMLVAYNTETEVDYFFV